MSRGATPAGQRRLAAAGSFFWKYALHRGATGLLGRIPRGRLEEPAVRAIEPDPRGVHGVPRDSLRIAHEAARGSEPLREPAQRCNVPAFPPSDGARKAELDDVPIVGVDLDARRRRDGACKPPVADVVREEAAEIRGPPARDKRRPVRLGFEPRGERGRRLDERPPPRHEHDVGAQGLPRLDVRKDRLERRVDRAHRARVDVVGLHPLHEYTVVGQPVGGGAVVLLREQARDASAIRIGRFRRDDIVAGASS